MTDAPMTLIADDQPDVLEALRLLLKREGFSIDAASSPNAVLEKVRDRDYDVLLMDLNYALDTTSGQEGLDLLSRVHNLDSSLPVVVMTAWGNVPLAVEALRRGARDFVEKPWENSHLLSTLRAQVAARAALRQDEREAALVQRHLLPRSIPKIAGCEIAVLWNPAEAVGGDYVDVLRQAPGNLAFGMADAIGKGFGGALLMSNVQAAVRVLASEYLPSHTVTERLNQTLCGNIGTGKFVTFFYGSLAGRRLTYCNAGHPAPILARASGETVRLEEGGAVLGVFPDWRYNAGTVDLEPGDRLLLFTDGVTEAQNEEGEDFGEARLAEVVRENRGLDAHALQKRVMAALSGYSVSDDITLLTVAME